MNSARAIAERRWRTRINWAVGLSWLALAGAVGWLGPLDRPIEAIMVAGIAYVSGLLVGFDKGGKRRRFLPIRGSGPRIRRSSGGRDGGIYQSYDILEHPFELTEEDVERLGRYALANTPFVIGASREAQAREVGSDAWDATWVLHTHDSAGRPTFLDVGSIVGMLLFVRADEDSQAFQMLKERLQATSLPEGR